MYQVPGTVAPYALPYLILTTLWEGGSYYPCFTDEENETEEIKEFTKVILSKTNIEPLVAR